MLPAHYMSIKEMNNDGSVSGKLGILYAQNNGLNIESDETFRRLVMENLPPQPNPYEQIRQTNMGKMSAEIESNEKWNLGRIDAYPLISAIILVVAFFLRHLVLKQRKKIILWNLAMSL